MNNSKTRRKFIKNSLLGTSALFLAPNLIGCSPNTNEVIEEDTINTLNEAKFNLGVASFDPTHNEVIIWTRYDSTSPQVLLQWQVALDADFTDVIYKGDVVTSASKDYTAAVRVNRLAANRTYYYRFIEFFNHDVSPIGETRTFSNSELSTLKLGVASCANYEAGYFNVYQEMANSDIDLVIHLGDYIYENGKNGFGSDNALGLNRIHNPETELYTIEDYRMRYKQYRGDENLKLLHQKKPFICIWDDHEISDNAYKNGAAGHQESEGSFEARKQVASQVYSEYLPFKGSNTFGIYRSFTFGSLAKIVMLDTRLIGRDKQLEYENYYDSENNFNAISFQDDLNDESRTMLGETQKNWLLDEIDTSSAEWLLLGQQVLMGKMYFPAELVQQLNVLSSEHDNNGEVSSETLFDLQSQLLELVVLKNRVNNNDTTLTQAEINRITNVLPYNLDAWDGYPYERELILNALESKKTIVLSGDSHNAWHNKIIKSNGTKEINEFATAGVTSAGFEELVTNMDQLNNFESASVSLIDGLQYFDAKNKGFVKVSLEKGSAMTEWISVASIIETPSSSQTNHVVNL